MNDQTLPTEYRPPALVAGARVRAIVPTTMEEAYRLAKAIVTSGMAPRDFNTPEKAMVAIMHGLEVGLTPMAALQRIAVVNGRPTLWGDAAMSLVRSSGACEWVKEWIDGETAYCQVKRKGEPESVVRTFSVADARKANLWGKAGPWTQYPDRMLSMRARAFALRDVFADVLGGMYLREEMDDTPTQRTADAVPPPPPAPVPMIEHAPASEPPAAAAEPSDYDPATGEIDDADMGEPFDIKDWFDALKVALAKCESVEDVNEVGMNMDVQGVCSSPTDMAIADQLARARKKELRGGGR